MNQGLAWSPGSLHKAPEEQTLWLQSVPSLLHLLEHYEQRRVPFTFEIAASSKDDTKICAKFMENEMSTSDATGVNRCVFSSSFYDLPDV